MLGWVIYQSQRPIVAINVNWIPAPHLSDVPLSIWNMTVGYPLDAPWYIVGGAIIAIALVLWGSVVAIRQNHDQPQYTYWVVQFWLLLWLVWGVSVIFQPAFVDRYLALLLPGVLLLLGWGLAHLPPAWARVVMSLLLIVITTNIVREYARCDDIRVQWAELTQQIETQRQPNDAIVMSAFFNLLEFNARDSNGWQTVHAEVAQTPDGGYDLVFESSVPPEHCTAAWVVVRTAIENIHRIGKMPDAEGFETPEDNVGLWLAQHRDRITAHWDFNGASLYYVSLAP